MAAPERVCVYCGSSDYASAGMYAAARALGERLARAGIGLVYGGGRVGLMGALADAVLAGGGEVIGIIPSHIQALEIDHDGLTELHVVESMHERKQMMAERAEGFVILPGGLGTLDETFEALTWRQLGLHDKPVVVVNVDGYWTPLVDLIDHMIAHGFVRPKHRGLLQVVATVADVLPALAAHDGAERASHYDLT